MSVLITTLLAISDGDAKRSLFSQGASMLLAVVVGRYVLRSRALIRCMALVEAASAMVAHVLVDGQGAFVLLFYAPVIYLLAVAGRNDLDAAPGG